MVRRRTKSLVATLAILTLVLSSVFAGAVTAQSDAPATAEAERTLQQTAYPADFVCKNLYTNGLRLVFNPSCGPYEQLIQISASLPFDYCYSAYTGIISDDYNDACNGFGKVYVVIDGLSSFMICANLYTGTMYQPRSGMTCTSGILVGFIDLRGDLTKYACVEENLNDNECDIIPGGGPQNEIRHLEPVVPAPFINATFRLEFRGDQTAVLSALSDVDTSPAGIQAALEALPSIGAGNVSVTAVDPGELWTTAADDFQTPDDESTAIRVEFTGALGNQDITDPITLINVQSTGGGEEFTLIDGTAGVSPGLNNVMPGGAVQVFSASAGTDPDNPATYGPEVTAGPQPVDASGAFSLTNLMEGFYVVCADGAGSVGPSCELVEINANSLTLVNNVDLPGTISAAITDTVGGNEVRSYDDIPFGGGQVTGGTYTITFDGMTTAAIAYDATAGDVQTALEALANIGAGNVAVTGGPPQLFGPPIVIEFVNALGGMNVPDITIDSSNLTGGGLAGYYLDPNLTDHDGYGTVQTISADARVSGGTFTLSYNGEATAPLDFDATVNEIETALNALSTINGGGGSVEAFSTDPNVIPGSEPITKAPIDIHFIGVAGSDATPLVVDNTNLE